MNTSAVTCPPPAPSLPTAPTQPRENAQFTAVPDRRSRMPRRPVADHVTARFHAPVRVLHRHCLRPCLGRSEPAVNCRADEAGDRIVSSEQAGLHAVRPGAKLELSGRAAGASRTGRTRDPWPPSGGRRLNAGCADFGPQPSSFGSTRLQQPGVGGVLRVMLLVLILAGPSTADARRRSVHLSSGTSRSSLSSVARNGLEGSPARTACSPGR